MKKSNWLGVIDNRLQIDAEIEEYISSNLSNGKVAITNANGKLRSSAVGIAELALISGVSSNVQEQLDALPSTYHPLISTGSLAQTKVDNLTNDLASKQNKSTAATDSAMGVVRVGSGLSIQSDSAHADYGSMSVNFSGYALSNDIPSDYVSTGSLETTLGDYALDSDIPSDYLTSNDIVWAGVASSTAIYHQNSVMIGATNAPSSKLEVKTSRASHTTEDTTTAFRATLTDTGVGETGIVAGQQSSTNVKTPFEVLANGSPVLSVSYDGTVTVNGTNHGSAVFKSTTAAVTQYSGDLVTSGAVYTAISNVTPSTTSSVSENSGALVTSGGVYSALESYVLDSDLVADYVSTTSLSTTLESYALDSDLVADYVSTTSLSTTLEPYALDSDLVADYVSTTSLSTTLESYALDSDLVADYVSTTSLSTTLEPYALDSNLVADYVSTTSLSTTLESYALDSDLVADYVSTTSLSTTLEPYALDSDLVADYVSTTSLSTTLEPYALDSDLVANYVSATSLSTALEPYVLDSDLVADYVSTTSLSTALEPYALDSDLVADYVSTTSLSTALEPYVLDSDLVADYVTTTALDTALTDYSQDAGISINSEDADIELKTGSTTRLLISSLGNNSTPGRINLNIGNLTGETDTIHGELRFTRGDNSSIRYHSILTKHSDNATRSALLFKVHDSTVGSANTGQREVLKLQGDGKCGINLTGDPTEILEVNGTVKATDFKYPITDAGVESDQSLVSLHSSVATLATNITSCVTTTALDTALGDYVLDSDLPNYAAFDSSTAGLVPASGGESTGKFLSQAGTFITPPPPAAPNLSAYVTTTALNTKLGDYVLDSDLPSTTDTVTSGSDALVTSGAVHTKLADYALDSDLPSTTDTVTSGSDALVTSGAVHTKLADYALDSDLPGIVYSVSDGSTLPVSSGAVFTALADNTVEPRVDLVGEFTLQTSENLRSSPTFLRWTPALVNVHGLTHNATNNIPQGTLFTCVVDRATYHINIMLVSSNAITNNRTYLSCTIRYYRKAPSTTGRGELDRTYFIGEGYCRAYNGTNQVWFGGDITLHMRELEQFEIVSVVRYATSSKAVPADASETLMRIERVVY